MADEGRKVFQNILFSKIVPNCKKLGLLDRNNGWLRQRFTELGVIQFEDWVDTGEEYAMLDEVAKDREAAGRRRRRKARSGSQPFRSSIHSPFNALGGYWRGNESRCGPRSSRVGG